MTCPPCLPAVPACLLCRESRVLRVPSLGRASRAGVTRIVVFGDMGVSEHATRMVAQLSREVTGGMVDAVLVGDRVFRSAVLLLPP